MSITTIVSGFPGVGKTHYYNLNTGVDDSDSSTFSWISTGVRNSKFPENYMEHIKKRIGKVSLLFVSSHKEVRDALVAAGLRFVLVFPEAGLKDEYLKRFEDRGSPAGFINKIKDSWDEFIVQLVDQEGCDIVRLKSGEHLSDRIDDIKAASVQ